MTVITVLPNGKVIAKASKTITVPLGGGDIAITITFNELRRVEQVLRYNFFTDPITDPGTPVNEKVTGNVVGLTMVGIPAGTTLTIEAVAIGW